MFQIKICGLTRAEDVAAVVAAGGDAIGLNFYEKSARSISLELATALAQAMPATVAKVGVFVNAPEAMIRDYARRVPLDYVQLHGDESPADLQALADLRLIKAFRVGANGIEPLLSFLAECQTRGCLPQAVLLDAFSRDAYGGTGQTIDWEQVHALQSQWPKLPIILAGGLHAANVAEAIQAAQPAAVDTASGVESSPGVKDHAKIAAFVTAAKYSWALSSGDPPEN